MVKDQITRKFSVVYYIEDESLRPENAQLKWATEDEKYSFANLRKVKSSEMFLERTFSDDALTFAHDLDKNFARVIVTNEHV